MIVHLFLSFPARTQSSNTKSRITPNPTLTHSSQSLEEVSHSNGYIQTNTNTATVTLTPQHRPIIDVSGESTDHEDTLAPETVPPLSYEVHRKSESCHFPQRPKTSVVALMFAHMMNVSP